MNKFRNTLEELNIGKEEFDKISKIFFFEDFKFEDVEKYDEYDLMTFLEVCAFLKKNQLSVLDKSYTMRMVPFEDIDVYVYNNLDFGDKDNPNIIKIYQMNEDYAVFVNCKPTKND